MQQDDTAVLEAGFENGTQSFPAHLLIGREGVFRLPGGRVNYEAVMAPISGDRPRLARIELTDDGPRQVNRYVDWDQPIDVDKLYPY